MGHIHRRVLPPLGILFLVFSVCRAESVCLVDASKFTLEQCLRNQSVTDIVLLSDHAVGQSLQKYAGAPFQIRRNITIRGPRGRQPDDWPVLDLNFADSVVELCATCQAQLEDIVLKNERRGAGISYDVFAGQPGSLLTCHNVYRLRLACTPPDKQLRAALAMKRSTLVPGSDRNQVVHLNDIIYKGKLYSDAVIFEDVSFDVPFQSVQEGRDDGTEGGYAQHCMGSVRLCDAYASNDCLLSNPADVCVNQIIDSMLSSQKASGGDKLPPHVVVAIALPVAFGVLLVVGGVGVWLVRRRRRQRAAELLPSFSSKQSGDDGSGSGGGGKASPTTKGTRCTRGTGSSTAVGSFGDRCPLRPGGNGKGWERVSSLTSPLLGEVDDATIELGEMIGRGSFGRVFKGRLNGMDVAVKVVEHNSQAAADVEQEMEMMIGLDHVNIVRAYHGATYAKIPSSSTSEYSMSRHNSLQVSNSMQADVLSQLTSCTPAGGAVTPAGSTPVTCCNTPAAATPPGSTRNPRSSTPDTANSCSCTDADVADVLQRRDSLNSCGHAQQSLMRQQSSMTNIAEATPAPAEDVQQPSAHAAGHLGRQNSCCSQQGGLPLPPSSSCTTSAQADSAGSTSRTGANCMTSSFESVDCRCHAADAFPRPKDQPTRLESWLVLEYCDCGCLSSFLSRWPAVAVAGCPGRCESTLVRLLLLLLLDAAKGLQELHSKHVVHGDLNARNVLVATDAATELGVSAKLADLGLSRSIRQHGTHRTTNTVGTMSHMPPEMLRSGHMSQAVDIYAFGIMMWELYTGQDAFQKLQHPGQFFETVVLQDLRPSMPTGMPADYQLLMQHCWATEPNARPDINRVLECLQYMVQDRQQRMGTAAAQGGAPDRGLRHVASAPLPALLLKGAPPRLAHWWQHRHPSVLKFGSDGASQASSFAFAGCEGGTGSASNSSSLLPVLDVKLAAQVPFPPTPVPDKEPLSQHEHHNGFSFNSQPLPAAAASRNSFSLLSYRHYQQSQQQLAAELQQRCNREDSVGQKSGKLGWLQGLKQSSFSLREMSFSSRGTSWSARQNSQTGSLAEHSWFV